MKYNQVHFTSRFFILCSNFQQQHHHFSTKQRHSIQQNHLLFSRCDRACSFPNTVSGLNSYEFNCGIAISGGSHFDKSTNLILFSVVDRMLPSCLKHPLDRLLPNYATLFPSNIEVFLDGRCDDLLLRSRLLHFLFGVFKQTLFCECRENVFNIMINIK